MTGHKLNTEIKAILKDEALPISKIAVRSNITRHEQRVGIAVREMVKEGELWELNTSRERLVYALR
jgi:hypothetical protein